MRSFSQRFEHLALTPMIQKNDDLYSKWEMFITNSFFYSKTLDKCLFVNKIYPMLGTLHIILVMEYRLMFQSLCGIVIFNMVNNTGPKITHKTTSGHGYEGFSIGWSLGMLMRVALLRLAVLGRPTMDISSPWDGILDWKKNVGVGIGEVSWTKTFFVLIFLDIILRDSPNMIKVRMSV